MLKRIVSGITLTLLFMGMLTLVFNIQPVRSEPTTWTVDDDGPADFHTIQEAINSPLVADWDTIYVYNGTYCEHVVVNKTVSLIGQNRNTTTIDGNHTGPVLNITSHNIKLTGFTVQNARAPILNWGTAHGIVIGKGSMSNNISHITVTNNVYGIWLTYSSDNIISDIHARNNSIGIAINRADNNTIFDNIITDNERGISGSGSFNILFNNSMTGNTYNFGWHSEFDNSIDISNRVDGKPIYYLKGVKNIVYDANIDVGTIYLIDCDNVTVRDLILTNNRAAVYLWNTTNSRIENVRALMTEFGIFLGQSINNTISSNNALNSYIDGISLEWNSRNNTISNNFISNSRLAGIFMRGSHDNLIYGNIVENAQQFSGIFLDDCRNNKIFHNNFIGNKKGAWVYRDSANLWDDGYPSGGNYWSDYTGSDVKSSPYQNETGSDGIGDTPYFIDENNTDHYPLMKPWPSAETATININPHTLNLKSKGRWITAYIRLPGGYNVQEVNASTILLNGTILAEIHPMDIGDEDCDGIPELMVKFNRAAVIEYILNSIKSIAKFANVTLTITGRLYNGTLFEGSDTIRVIKPVDKSPKGNQTPQETDTLVRQIPKPEFRMPRRRKIGRKLNFSLFVSSLMFSLIDYDC